jgi:hypothetical protein
MNAKNNPMSLSDIWDQMKFSELAQSTKEAAAGATVKATENYKSNDIILAVTLFTLVIGGYYFFNRNPNHVLDYVYVPFVLLYVFVLFLVLIFVELRLEKGESFMGESATELFVRITRHTTQYGTFVAIVLLMAVVGYYIYRGAVNATYYSLRWSFSFTFGLVVLFLATMAQQSKGITMNNPILELIKNVVMYLPCLISDTIDYMKKDYQDTPSTVLIVFALLVLYLFLWLLIPTVRKEFSKNQGALLVDQPVYLNQTVALFTREKLLEKISDARPFYDRIVQRILMSTQNIDLSMNHIEVNSEDKAYDVSVNSSNVFHAAFPPDRRTNKSFKDNVLAYPDRYMIKEAFTMSAVNNDRQALQNVLNFLTVEQQRILDFVMANNEVVRITVYSLQQTSDLLKQYVNSIIQSSPELLSALDKFHMIMSMGRAARDATFITFLDMLTYVKPEEVSSMVRYHYALSFWVYLEKTDANPGLQTIVAYDVRPSLFYDTTNQELVLTAGTAESAEPVVLFKTNKIIFQRWNHVVLNYNYGQLDLVINNNIVGNFQHLVPKLDPYETLVIGSVNNSEIGGICNVRYFELPLTASQISSIYTTYNGRSPPI